MEKEGRIRRLRNATLAQLGLAIVSAGASVITGNHAFAAELRHDVQDTVLHGSKYAAERQGIDQERRAFQWFLRGSMAALSIAAATKGYDIFQDIQEGTRVTMDMTEATVTTGSAVAIAAGNTYSYVQLRGINEHSHASASSLGHAEFDMVASWGLSGSLLLETAGVQNASLYGGLLFAGYTTVEAARHAIRPAHVH